MTTPDYPDWQTPVALVDQAVYVGGAPYVLQVNGALPIIDVSAFNSLGLEINLPPSAGTNRYQLQTTWMESNAAVAIDYLTFNGSAGYTLPLYTDTFWQLPVRGGQLQLALSGTDTSACTINLLGSTRSLDGGQQKLSGGQGGKAMARLATTSVPAGGSLPIVRIPPVARAYSFRLGGTDTHLSYTFTAITGPNGAMRADSFYDLFSTGTNPMIVEIPCPGIGLELTIANSDTVVHSANMVAWDVS